MQISLQILNQKHRLTAAVLLAAGLLAGCANTTAPATPTAAATPAAAEDIVSQRAQQRVDLLAVGKYDQAYVYLAPSYRALNSVENYRGQFGMIKCTVLVWPLPPLKAPGGTTTGRVPAARSQPRWW